MTIGLTVACSVLGTLCVLLAGLLLWSRSDRKRLRSELKRFDAIKDAETYAAELVSQQEATKRETDAAEASLRQLSEKITGNSRTISSQDAHIARQQQQLTAVATKLGAYKNLDDLREHIAKQKRQVQQYNQVLGNFKSAQQLAAHIDQLKSRIAELNHTIGRFDTVAKLDAHISAKQMQVAGLESRVTDLSEVLGGADTARELHDRIEYQQNLLAQLRAEEQQVEEALEMQEFGFYRPVYGFETSSEYQRTLDSTRAQQKHLTKAETAVAWDKQWVVEGSEAKGRKMMKEQTKLMLRAFNGECDAAIAKVKYNNAKNMENRITRSCEQINKLGKTNCASITSGFLRLKLDELHLVHEHRVKKEEEREEQRRIKEQMREEERVKKEVEKAQKEAEKEECAVEQALEKARLEFEKATHSQMQATAQTEAQNAALAEQVAKLESELKDAIDRKAKAIARAQLTKSGHVYILSNIGSFGEGVFKIGMTRRLEPLERVKELSDASVPFNFDVHAMIYSENAPELETQLHQHFSHRRVNLVNLRREYFHVTLDEVREAVTTHFGTVTFVTIAEAAEYRETMAKRREDEIRESVSSDRPPQPVLQAAVVRAL